MPRKPARTDSADHLLPALRRPACRGGLRAYLGCYNHLFSVGIAR